VEPARKKSVPPPRQERAAAAAADSPPEGHGEGPWEPGASQDEIVEVSKPRVVARRKPQHDPEAERATAAGAAPPEPEPAWSAEPFAAGSAPAGDVPEFSFGGDAAARAQDDSSFASLRRAGVNGVGHLAGEEPVAKEAVPELGAGWEMPENAEPSPADAPEPAANGEDRAAAALDDAPAPFAPPPADEVPAEHPSPLEDPLTAASAHPAADDGGALVPPPPPDDAAAPQAEYGESAAPPAEQAGAEAHDGAAASEAVAPPTAPARAQPPPPPADAVAPPASDADEAHFFETFQKFLALREQTGEPGTVSYEKFVAKLRKNREDLIARHRAKGVRFSVYLKDGRAAIKASAIR
jgi:hypothetical protein